MNQAVEEFNRQLKETIYLLEREASLLERNRTRKTAEEERIIDEIKRRT